MSAPAGPSEPLLEVRDLTVDIRSPRGPIRVVKGVSLKVHKGETVGIVGESGSGKSMTAYALMDLFPTPAAHVSGGSIRFQGRELRGLAPKAWRALRGARIAMIFQDPSAFLDPLMPVGRQVAETLYEHGRKEGVQARVLELLALMELPDPPMLAGKYPHELSGGQRQRIMIASALAMEPDLLIADEPTTALDVTVQAGILTLLTSLRDRMGLGLILITHDLGVVAETCDRVHVMHNGIVVEEADVFDLFERPQHDYTRGLLRNSLPLDGAVHLP